MVEMALKYILLIVLTYPLVFGRKCWHCKNARSNSECLRKGRLEQCLPNQNHCQNEVRAIAGGRFFQVTKRCKQANACNNNRKQNSTGYSAFQCDAAKPHSVCRCCCHFDNCNGPSVACPSGLPACSTPSTPNNGFLLCPDRPSVGSYCFYKCTPGFKLVGHYSTQCRSSGLNIFWTNNPPQCIGDDRKSCKETDHQCKNGVCISPLKFCDGFDNCGDGSDEDACPPEVDVDDYDYDCPSSDFDCGDGACLDFSLRCNGFDDCSDSRDERNCTSDKTCLENEITCSNNSCVSRDKVCDGTNDCSDGADESECPVSTTPETNLETVTGDYEYPEYILDCLENEISCDGLCISDGVVCDGQEDCFDGVDEMNCTVAASPSTMTAS